MDNQDPYQKIKFRGKEYFCSLDLTLSLIGGKWKTMMIYMLKDGALRSSDLQRKMPEESNKMFTQTARDLERNGILRRKVYPVVPPRVEYELTELGMSVLPIIFQMCDWGTNLLEAESEITETPSNHSPFRFQKRN